MSDVQVAGITYRIGRLNAVQQFDIVRRLGPLISIMAQERRQGAEPIDGVRWVMASASGLMAEMKQSDTDFLIQACLSAVEMQTATAPHALWAKIMVGGNLMFQDMPLSTMMELMDRVLQENLGDFFAKLRGVSGGAPPQMEPAPAS